MSRPALGAAALFFLALLAWGLWPTGPETDEDRIRLVLDEMAQAVADRKPGDVVEHFSESYKGELGDKRGVHGYATAMFFRSQAVVAVPSGVEVKVAGDRADVSLRLNLARAPGAGAGNDVLGSHLIDATFAKEDGEWRVLSAKRRP